MVPGSPKEDGVIFNEEIWFTIEETEPPPPPPDEEDEEDAEGVEEVEGVSSAVGIKGNQKLFPVNVALEMFPTPCWYVVVVVAE